MRWFERVSLLVVVVGGALRSLLLLLLVLLVVVMVEAGMRGSEVWELLEFEALVL